MLKHIDPVLSGDLLLLLDAMGHGDELVLADRNFPAHAVALETATGQLIVDKGVDSTRMARAIFSVLPLDSYVEAPLLRMEQDDKPREVLAVHAALHREAELAEGKPVTMASIERQAFYAAARRAYCVVQTGETRPYACFIIKKGVIFAASEGAGSDAF